MELETKMEVTLYTPEKFFEDANRLVQLIANYERIAGKFEVILGIGRGGIPLALHLASNLNITNLKQIQLLKHPQNKIEIIQAPDLNLISGKKILIVDDLIDEGKTYQFLCQFLADHGIHSYKLAVLVDKQNHPHVTVDFCVRNINNWVIFFWEREFYPHLL